MKKMALSPDKVFDLISKATKTPVEILDKLALFATVDLVANGLSNEIIAKKIGIDISDVEEDLAKLSDFTGFTESVSFSPYFIFNQANEDENKFRELLENQKGLDKLYVFMVQYTKLRKELNEFYGITWFRRYG